MPDIMDLIREFFKQSGQKPKEPFLRGVPDEEAEHVQQTLKKIVEVGQGSDRRKWALQGIVGLLAVLNSMPEGVTNFVVYELHKREHWEARFELYYNLLNFFVGEFHEDYQQHKAALTDFVQQVIEFIERTSNGSQTPNSPQQSTGNDPTPPTP